MAAGLHATWENGEKNANVCPGEQRPKTGQKNTINYHLMRLYPKIKGPTKQGK